MVDSVLFARDKWLKPFTEGGRILPDRAVLYVAGLEDSVMKKSEIGVWDDFHGLNYSALGRAWAQVAAQQCALRDSVVTAPAVLLDVDLNTAAPNGTADFVARGLRLPARRRDEVNALIGWFDLDFFAFEGTNGTNGGGEEGFALADAPSFTAN